MNYLILDCFYLSNYVYQRRNVLTRVLESVQTIYKLNTTKLKSGKTEAVGLCFGLSAITMQDVIV